MPANERIRWLHGKIAGMTYPNAKHISERFGISHRQAQRDVDFMKNTLLAPLGYSYDRKGFYYSAPFELPVGLANDQTTVSGENPADKPHAKKDFFEENLRHKTFADLADDSTAAFHSINNRTSRASRQQIDYSAVVRVGRGLTIPELASFIKERSADGDFLCEFRSIEGFMSTILSLEADITIIKPDWLRQRLIRCAQRIISNNSM